MRDGNTFRRTGGPGRVDQIRGVIASQRRRAVGVADNGLVTDITESVDRDPVRIAGQELSDSRIGQSHNSIAVPNHVSDSFDRVRGVHRNTGGAGLGNRPPRDDGIDRSGQRDRHTGTGSYSEPDEHSSKNVGSSIEFAVGELPSSTLQCDPLRRRRDAGRENRGQCHRLQRGRSARRNECHPFLVAQDLEIENPGVRQRVTVANQQVDVPTNVVAEGIRVVQIGIGLEIDSRRIARRTRIDVDRQVFHRPRRQHVESTGYRTQDHFGVKVHDVDRGTEESTLGAEASIASHVFGAVSLMSERTGQFQLDCRPQFGDGGPRSHRDSYRNDIGDHSTRTTQNFVRSRSHRQTQDHVFGAGHTGEIERKGRYRHHRRESVRADHRIRSVEWSSDNESTRCGVHPPAGQARCCGKLSRLGCPVVPIPGESRRTAILGLGRVHGTKIVGRGFPDFEAGDLRRVQLGDACHEIHGAVAVEYQMVDPAVPEMTVRADAQDRRFHQPISE
ncbi:hypothetical protein BKP42_20560 [Rhodococcus erythropolis]|nr:hypothetical protein BKP42_20560 [Rhodococcus erythropolis]